METEKARFAAGCFWGVEESFARLDGVISTQVGYSGGRTKDPTYRQVCHEDTGHAEAVEIEYDPERITYQELLDHLFTIHDPTTLDRQGPDVGSQYRSMIFYYGDQQRKVAEETVRRWQPSFKRGIVTQIVPAGPFYRAEEFHQRYIAKGGIAFCHI